MWPAIIGAAGSAISSGISAWQADKASKRQFGQQKELMKLQDTLNRNQYEWQYNKFLSPAAQREQYEAAGFNVNDVARQGGSMIQSGNLGGVSGGSTSAVMPDTSGISNAGNILAQGAKTASETKLNLQKAITEQKMQYLHDTSASLNLALKDSEVAKTSLTNIHTWIAERTKKNKVKLSDLEVDTVTENLLILHEELTNAEFRNQFMNPAAYAQAQADYGATIAMTLLTMTDVQLKQHEMDYIVQQVKTSMSQEYLNYASSHNAIAQSVLAYNQASKVGAEALIEHQKAKGGYGTAIANYAKADARIHGQRAAFNYGQHEAEVVKWTAKGKKREYKWAPALNTMQMIESASRTAVNACEVGATFMTGGLSQVGKQIAQSKVDLYKAIARKNSQTGQERLIFDSNGKQVGGFSDVIIW